jgi:GT2 family glycosyltransferase
MSPLSSPVKKVAVILLNWNGWEDTLECLSSLYACDWPNLALYVGDNGSTDQSVHAIRSAFPKCRLLELGQNYGFAEGCNKIVEVALQEGADYIFYLNNDTVVDPSLISVLVRHHEQLGPRVGLGCNIGYASKPEITWDFGSIWDPGRGVYHKVGRDQSMKQHQDIVEVDHVVGCAMFFSAETLREIGLFDRRFFLNFEETDLCSRARKMGVRFYSIPEAKLWHKISASFEGKLHNLYFFVRNRGLWMKKHFTLYERMKWYFMEGGFKKSIIRLLRVGIALATLPLWIWSSSLRASNGARLVTEGVLVTALAHHLMGRYGTCPDWVLKASRLVEKWRKISCRAH